MEGKEGKKNNKKTNFRKSFKLKICQFMLSHRKIIFPFEFNDVMAVADRCLNPFQYFKAKILLYIFMHMGYKVLQYLCE